jgi:hypothetical protein
MRFSPLFFGRAYLGRFDLIKKEPSEKTSFPPDWDSVVNALQGLGFDPAPPR